MNSSSFSSGGANQNRPSGSSATPASFANYNFDFGLGPSLSGRSSASRPLKEQKQPEPTYYTAVGGFSSSTAGSRPATPAASSWSPNNPSWTHQPAPSATAAARSSLSNPTSMVGDIFGKSWSSSAPSTATTAGIGLPKANPNLFGDLLGSALGKGGSTGGGPLNSSAPPKNTFSMGGLSNSLPHAAAARPTGYTPTVSSAGSQRAGTSMTGGTPMKSSMAGAPMSAQKKDPFGSLMDFGSKSAASSNQSLNSNSKSSSGSGGAASDDFGFGAFQNANPPKTNSFNMPPPPAPDFFAKSSPAPQPDVGGADPLDNLFTSSASSTTSAADGGSGNQPFSEADGWDLGGEFGGGDGGGPTTELEGLPPPPSGITASAAKSKGMENYKQGQFPDAIKWLSWAVLLLEKSGDKTAAAEVLTCRASCYKEVGEYKKAVADCTMVLEQDNENVAVLLQRALLYESTEKYKLGAEDLRTVLKIDPTNRLARTTIHRLTQLAG